MSHNPEQQAKIINFPLERARLHHLDVSFDNLKSATAQTPPDVAQIAYFQTPAEITAMSEAAKQVQPINLDTVREQIRREAA